MEEKQNEVTVERRIYPAYADMEEAIKKYPVVKQRFGKYQLIFSSKKGKISLIELKENLSFRKNVFEVFCLEGDLFEHEQRFDTEEEAEKCARELLK